MRMETRLGAHSDGASACRNAVPSRTSRATFGVTGAANGAVTRHAALECSGKSENVSGDASSNSRNTTEVFFFFFGADDAAAAPNGTHGGAAAFNGTEFEWFDGAATETTDGAAASNGNETTDDTPPAELVCGGHRAPKSAHASARHHRGNISPIGVSKPSGGHQGGHHDSRASGPDWWTLSQPPTTVTVRLGLVRADNYFGGVAIIDEGDNCTPPK